MKTPLRTRLAICGAGLLSWACLCHESQAQGTHPIKGSIDFVGVVSFDTLSLATATTVDTWNSCFVTQDSLDFASFVPPGTNVTMADPWVFNSGSPPPGFSSPGPATPGLWSVGGFTFDLTTSTVVSQTASFLNITGVGTASGHGFDATPGTWSFTSSKASGSDSNTFGFQANTAAVPESSTISLLAMGAVVVAGISLARRRTKLC